jgi:D-threo-aldose 1-dehydrogenase
VIEMREIGQTGVRLSRLGFGAGPLGGFGGLVDPIESSQALLSAQALGIRHVDTAPHYGNGRSELRVGQIVRELPIGAMAVSTKIGRVLQPIRPNEKRPTERSTALPFKSVFGYDHDSVMRSVEQSLTRLGVDRVDILLIHDLDSKMHPDPAQLQSHVKALVDGGGFKALEELRSQGVCRAIGAGLNRSDAAVRLMSLLPLDLLLLAEPYNLLDQGALTDLLPALQKNPIPLVLGGIYASGILVRGADFGTYAYGKPDDDTLRRTRKIEALCLRHQVELGAAAMQFALAHPSVTTVLPGMRSVSEVQANVRFFSAKIPMAFWEELRAEGLVARNAPLPATGQP